MTRDLSRGRARSVAIAISAALLLTACGGGSDDASVDTEDLATNGTVTTTTTTTTTATATTPTSATAPASTVAPEGASADGGGKDHGGDSAAAARARARRQRLMEYARKWRKGQKEHAEDVASKPKPAPAPPATAPPPTPPPVDPVAARLERFAALCVVSDETGFTAMIAQATSTDADAAGALESLPETIGALLAFYDAGRPVAPADLSDQMAILDPFVNDLRTTLEDLEAVGTVAGDEAWFEAVISTLLNYDGAFDALLSVVAEVSKNCL